MPTLDPRWRDRALAPADVVAHVPDGAHVFVQGAAMTPTPLLQALCERPDFDRVTLYHLHLEGPIPFTDHCERIRSVSFFTGPALRGPVNRGQADFVPVFLKDVPVLFRRGVVPLDAVFVRVSPPDRHGLCTLGLSVDATLEAVRTAKTILAVVDDNVPRGHGPGFLPFERIDAFCLDDAGPYAHDPAPRSEVEETIGALIADLVEDGSTLQMGIGAIPDAVLARLGDKRDLGVHTEMFSDGVLDLVEGGVITNRHKVVHPGRMVTSFLVGSRRLYDFVDDNPLVELHPCDRTNDTAIIRMNPRVVAVNSALAVDLSGQVQADSLGAAIYSGIGGQMDFIHGAALSEGGKPIIALPATAKAGTVSRITPTLVAGAGVVTTRGHVHWVVTEFGAVNLFGQSLRRRGELLIGIAHPDFREELRRELVGLRHFTF
ncbi:MAG: 4-hydroxybutyrate CoA-transferase [Sandaracinus sp.]|nr:4-hydroxybutyrate CoA-transferase [Sandaracinus sp.]|tara:strand:- start:137 stop:1432 length:1296 start_codon:yes stop_codon:yes gene_type:complete